MIRKNTLLVKIDIAYFSAIPRHRAAGVGRNPFDPFADHFQVHLVLPPAVRNLAILVDFRLNVVPIAPVQALASRCDDSNEPRCSRPDFNTKLNLKICTHFKSP